MAPLLKAIPSTLGNIEVEGLEPPSQAFSDQNHDSWGGASWFTSLGNSIDMRLLLVGSLLPDIIDKPVGMFFFRDSLSNGRIFCHTLLFLILVTVAGLYFYRRYSKTWLLAFSFGTLTHLVFDQMWRTPQTLFWPLFGLPFERADIKLDTKYIPCLAHRPCGVCARASGINNTHLVSVDMTAQEENHLLHQIRANPPIALCLYLFPRY